MNRAIISLVVALVATFAFSATPALASDRSPAVSERVHVKFEEGTDVRLHGSRLVSESGADLASFEAVLRRFPGVHVERLFTRPEAALAQEKKRIEARSHRKVADLNLYFRLLTRSESDSADLVEALNGLDVVETAYAEPEPAPTPATPSFLGLQGYRGAAPAGIDVGAAAAYPGAKGDRVKIIDVEYSWNLNHEDLSKARSAFIPSSPNPYDLFGDRNHGTAVLGELVGDDNGFGVTGLVPNAQVGVVNHTDRYLGQNIANAIDVARANLSPGDVLLLEAQTTGWNCADRNCYVPVEWIPAVYDAIVRATVGGIIVVEAAGNGGQNLDDPYYGSPFPSGKANSGAIIVGAGGSPSCSDWPQPARSRLQFSTYGSRVDVQGWGECVTTTGYRDLHQGLSENSWYTQSFSGTSSASPIVAAAAASLSSAYETATGGNLRPQDLRAILVRTGTAQDTSSAGALGGKIGPLPNLAAALAQTVDTSAPVVSEPVQNVALNWTLGTTAVPVSVSWSASDSSGIAQYALQVSTNGGAWANEVLPTSTTRSKTLSLAPGSTYAFRVAARDGAGNWSSWVSGPSFRVDAHQETSSAITYSSGWNRVAWSYSYGGYQTGSTTVNASARLSFTGRNVAWVAPTAVNRGQAYVYVDGVYVKSLDLYSASTVARKVVFAKRWAASGPHTLTVKVVGTTGRPKIDVDAFIVLR